MNNFLDFIIPRFVTDKVAVTVFDDGTWEPLCYFEELFEGEAYDAVYTITSFNFFGHGFFPKIIDIEEV